MNIASFFLLFIFFLFFLSSSNTYGNLKLFWKSSIDTHLQVIFFIWFLFFVLLFWERQLWPKAVGSLEKPWRWKLVARISKSLDKFATILTDLFCYHSILETFVLSIVTLRREFFEDKENFLRESLFAQFLRYYIFGFILSNFVNTHINIATIFV